MTEKATENPPRLWPLKCSQCGDRVQIEVPFETEGGETGIAKCRRRHALLYGYDGVTVTLLEVLPEAPEV